ncbi:hypothetical protein B0J18DRAFT_417568 [Chaetomium sp. MPI-SDFR-AT-0129]|nr:hypothetical protein B0J18DRAFT_417568 [Chaetomium sp. MPI-SDFR-AT-0129]
MRGSFSLAFAGASGFGFVSGMSTSGPAVAKLGSVISVSGFGPTISTSGIGSGLDVKGSAAGLPLPTLEASATAIATAMVAGKGDRYRGLPLSLSLSTSGGQTSLFCGWPRVCICERRLGLRGGMLGVAGPGSGSGAGVSISMASSLSWSLSTSMKVGLLATAGVVVIGVVTPVLTADGDAGENVPAEGEIVDASAWDASPWAVSPW